MDFSDEMLTIETPENVAFGYPVAGIGSRFIAALVDTTLIVVLQIVVSLFGFLLISNLFSDAVDAAMAPDAIAWVLGIAGLISFIFLWGYYIFFEMLWNGQSPGKRLAKLRVIRADGTPVTLAESIIRNLVRLVDFLPVFYGAAVVAMFIDSRARRLGDMAAGTLVVRESDARIDAGRLHIPANPPGFPPLVLEKFGRLPLEKLTGTDLDALDSYLKRRNEFSNAHVVGEKLLARLFQRMEVPLPELNRWEVSWLLKHIHSLVSAAG